MIYTTKTALANILEVHRSVIETRIKNGQVVKICNQRGRKLGYIDIVHFLSDLKK